MNQPVKELFAWRIAKDDFKRAKTYENAVALQRAERNLGDAMRTLVKVVVR